MLHYMGENMEGEYLYRKDPFTGSSFYTDNFLWNHEKIYIMDNHRLAAWCWKNKIEHKKSTYIFHLDKHYDDVPIYEKGISKIADFDFYN